ncbi:MAG: DNA-binding protein [Lysinibacillus sp.]
MEINLIWIGVGLVILGYFIADGLRNFGNPKKGSNYFYFLKENELHYYVNLSEKEIKELLREYPGAPKVVLNGNTYYPTKQFQDWLHTIELNKNNK